MKQSSKQQRNMRSRAFARLLFKRFVSVWTILAMLGATVPFAFAVNFSNPTIRTQGSAIDLEVTQFATTKDYPAYLVHVDEGTTTVCISNVDGVVIRSL